MKALLEIFLTFAKIGGVTFGGGYAMLPILQREVVDNKNWTTHEELMDYYAIGQSTPGIIAVNTATFIGHKHKGALGGIAATLGVIFPSLLIITIVAMFISNFADSAILQNAFAGIRVSVYVLILNAVIGLWKKAVTDKLGLMIFMVVFTASIFTSWSPVLFVVFAAIVGLVAQHRKKEEAHG